MDLIKDSETYFNELARTMREVFYPCVDRIAHELLRAYDNGRSVYIFGNGGSAATASHFACDLSKGTIRNLPSGTKRLRVVALTDNIPVMTAWANDASYTDIFAEQLQNLLAPDDVVLAISGSGNSPNILKALELALRSGAYTIGLTGFKGGKMKPLCRTCLVVPSDNMEVIEDVHMATCHAVASVIRRALTDARARGDDQTLVPTVAPSVPAANRLVLSDQELKSLGIRSNGTAVRPPFGSVQEQGPAGD